MACLPPKPYSPWLTISRQALIGAHFSGEFCLNGHAREPGNPWSLLKEAGGTTGWTLTVPCLVTFQSVYMGTQTHTHSSSYTACIIFPYPSIFSESTILLVNKHSVIWGFLGGLVVKILPANAGDMGSIPGSGRPPGEGNGNWLHVLAWETAWTEDPGGLQHSIVLRRDGHDWLTEHTCSFHYVSVNTCKIYLTIFLS